MDYYSWAIKTFLLFILFQSKAIFTFSLSHFSTCQRMKKQESSKVYVQFTDVACEERM
jgi:hypothetical protein